MPKHVSLLKTRLKLSSRRRLKLWHFKIRLGDSVSGKVRFLCPIPIQFRPPRSSSDRQREFFPQLFVFKVLTEAFLLISPQQGQDRTLAGRETKDRSYNKNVRRGFMLHWKKFMWILNFLYNGEQDLSQWRHNNNIFSSMDRPFNEIFKHSFMLHWITFIGILYLLLNGEQDSSQWRHNNIFTSIDQPYSEFFSA